MALKTIGPLVSSADLNDNFNEHEVRLNNIATPTGTGFVRVTNGVQDAAASLPSKADVGLGNVDNTSDANKPISDATQAALDTRATTAALSTHANNTNNPHGVTKAQVGLGNVDNVSAASLRDRSTHTGTQSADTLTDGATNKAFLATERTKLAGIATGATANDTDANLKNRANHTGTQAASTITGLGDAATKNTGTAAGTVAAGDDGRFSNARTPTGAAGGVLSGTYPNPTFASAMATQAALDAHTGNTANPHSTQFAQLVNKPTTLAGFGIAGIPAQARVTGWYNLMGAAQYENDVLLANQRLYWMPFWISETSGTYSALRLYVATAGAAGSTLAVGLFNDNNGTLGTQSQDWGSVAADTVGWKEIVFANLTLAPSRYWMGILHLTGGVAATVRCYRGNNGVFGVGAAEDSEPGFYRNGITAMPGVGNALGGSGTTAGAIPRVRLRHV